MYRPSSPIGRGAAFRTPSVWVRLPPRPCCARLWPNRQEAPVREAGGCGFESRRPHREDPRRRPRANGGRQPSTDSTASLRSRLANVTGCPRGQGAACKAEHAGSNPVPVFGQRFAARRWFRRNQANRSTAESRRYDAKARSQPPQPLGAGRSHRTTRFLARASPIARQSAHPARAATAARI